MPPDIMLREIEKLIKEKEVPTYPCLTKMDIENFNEQYGVELPTEYVLFLTTVGDGWKKVRNQHFSSVCMNRLNQTFRKPNFLKKDFPFWNGWIWEDDDDEAVFPRKPDESEKEYKGRISDLLDSTVYGHLTLIELGDGAGWDLILNGPSKGQIWFFCGEGMSPCKPKLTFFEWLLKWLNGNQEISNFI